MAVLPNFPMVSQLTQTSWDGSSPNSQMDCVPACLCAGAMYFKGVAQVNQEYNPDRFLDAAYGEGHRGGTDAKEYVNFLASLGIRLSSAGTASASFLVEETHTLLAKGCPVILTILDPYVPASYGWTHAVIAFAEKTGEITVLDPYIGKPVTKSDAEWAALLRSDLLWTMEFEMLKIDLSMPEVASHFTANGASWLCKQTGKPIGGAILTFYQSYGNTALCGLTFLGLPLSGEKPIQQFAGYEKLAGKGIVLQPFERGILIYDPGHEYDNPPGAGAVYLAHLYSGAGVDPEVAQLQAQLTAARAQPAAPQEHAVLLQMTEAGAQALGKHLV